MDSVETNKIRINLSDLVKNTLCNTTFLAIFLETRVLSAEDVEAIKIVEQNKGRYSAADKFYELVVTRKNSFDVLLKALKDTKQSGALQILGKFEELNETPVNTISSSAVNSENQGTPIFSRKYTRAPTYMTKFQKITATTILIVICEECSVTSERIQETVQNCEIYTFEEFQELVKTYRFPTRTIPVVEIEEFQENILVDASNKKIKAVILFPKRVEEKSQYNTRIKQLSDRVNISVENDTLNWNDLSTNFQNEIYFRLERDLQLTKVDIEDTMKGLENCTLVRMAKGILLQISCNDNVWSIFKNYVPDALPYYIPRTLITRKFIGNEIFSMNCDDIFLFTGASHQMLENISGKTINTTTCFIEEKYKTKTRFFSLENFEDSHTICKNRCSMPIHLLEILDGKIIWKQSRGNLDTIQRLLEDKQSKIHETDFVDDIVKQQASQRFPVCIADTPGMGKSVLLGNICRKLRGRKPNQHVSYLEIRKLVEEIKKLGVNEFMNIDQKSLLFLLKEAILKCLCANKISYLYLRKYEQTLTELLLDGFDELDPTDEDLGYNCLKFASLVFPQARIWVATRPHMLYKLENLLSVMGFNIQGFNEEDQVNCLTSFWTRNCKRDMNILKVNQFAKRCLNDLKKTLEAKDHDIAGIPLQCYLIAEVYEDTAIQFMKTINDKPSQCLETFTTIRNLIELYEKLVEKKLAKFYLNYPSEINLHLEGDLDKERLPKRDLINAHIFESIELLFPSEVHLLEQTLCSPTVWWEHLVSVGFLEAKSYKSSLVFIHRTFAEYFVALFIIDVLQGQQLVSNSDTFLSDIFKTQIVEVKLPNGALVKSNTFECNVICYFINMLLRNIDNTSIDRKYLVKFTKPELLEACASGNFENMFSLMLRSSEICKVFQNYESTKTLLFLYTYHGCLKMFKECSERHFFKRFMTKIRWHGLTVLHIAVAGGNFQMVKYLCEHRNFKNFIVSNLKLFENLVHICVHNTTTIDGRSLGDRINVLGFLARIAEGLLKPGIEKSPTVLEQNDVHPSLKKQFLHVITIGKQRDILKCCLHKAATLLSTQEYTNLFKKIMYQKSQNFVTVMLKPYSEDRSLLFHILDKSEPSNEILEYLVNVRADFDERVDFQSLFEIALRRKRKLNCLLILAKHVKLNEKDVVSSSIYLFKHYDTATVKTVLGLIINKISDTLNTIINSKGWENNTILHMLMESEGNENLERAEVALFLLENGADVEARNSYKETPLHVLANKPNVSKECWDLLVTFNANINAKDVNGQTPNSRLLENKKSVELNYNVKENLPLQAIQ